MNDQENIQLNDEIVKKYIQYLTSFLPNQDMIDYIEKYNDAIKNDPYYNAWIKIALEQQQANEEFYRELEANNDHVMVEESDNTVGFVKLIRNQAQDIVISIEKAMQKLVVNYEFSMVRGDYDDNDLIHLEYDDIDNRLVLYSPEKHNFYLEIEDDLIYPINTEPEFDSALLQYIYEFDQKRIPEDTEIEITYDN